MRGTGCDPRAREGGPIYEAGFLGIEIDTVKGRLALPAEKLSQLWGELERWRSRRACCRRELEALSGIQQHAAQVIRPGRMLVRQMIDLLKGPRRPRHFLRLNHQFRADLYWWSTFAASWNGEALFPPAPNPTVEFASDASGSWGCGAWCGERWWQLRWPQGRESKISFKELFAVVVLLAVWGRGWRGQQGPNLCQPLYPPTFSSCYWTRTGHGPRQTGRGGSPILRARPGPFHQ